VDIPAPPPWGATRTTHKIQQKLTERKSIKKKENGDYDGVTTGNQDLTIEHGIRRERTHC